MNTAFNRRHHLNRWCAVLTRDSIYALEYVLCESDKQMENVNARAWFHIRDCVCDFRMRPNGPFHVAIGANRPIRVSRQAFPRKIGHKVRGVSDTNRYRNVRYATAMSYTAYMESRYTNPTKNGKRTVESRILRSGRKILDSIVWFECLDRLSEEK